MMPKFTVRRTFPSLVALRGTVSIAPPSTDLLGRRLEACLSVLDLRARARRRVPRAVFDYVDGGAESEAGLRRARDAYRDSTLVPSVLRDVSRVELDSTLLGVPTALPIALAPTGFTRLVHAHGEAGAARAAQDHGIPYILSSMTSTPLDDVAAAAGERWFQLYLWRDRAAAEALIREAVATGFTALVLTVDVPVAGDRRRDRRNGFSAPPVLTTRTAFDIARHPAWAFDLLTTPPLRFAALPDGGGDVGTLVSSFFDPGVTVDDLAWLRTIWPGKLVVKGVQSLADAVRVVDAGADAIVLSNHGGRQLDRTGAPLHLLPAVRAELGADHEIMIDSGILTGGDVVTALAAGANGVLIGRAHLYGLMAGGHRGVQRALTILTEEMRRTMALLGVQNVAELGPEHVRLAT